MKQITHQHYPTKTRHKWAGADDLNVGDIVKLTSNIAWCCPLDNRQWFPLGPKDIMVVVDVQTRASGSHVTVMHNGNLMTRVFAGARSLEYMFERLDSL